MILLKHEIMNTKGYNKNFVVLKSGLLIQCIYTQKETNKAESDVGKKRKKKTFCRWTSNNKTLPEITGLSGMQDAPVWWQLTLGFPAWGCCNTALYLQTLKGQLYEGFAYLKACATHFLTQNISCIALAHSDTTQKFLRFNHFLSFILSFG